jgi:hypothetical protein
MVRMDSLWHLLPPPRTTPAPVQCGGGRYFDVSPSGPESLKGSRLGVKQGGAEARYFNRAASIDSINQVKQ